MMTPSNRRLPNPGGHSPDLGQLSYRNESNDQSEIIPHPVEEVRSPFRIRLEVGHGADLLHQFPFTVIQFFGVQTFTWTGWSPLP